MCGSQQTMGYLERDLTFTRNSSVRVGEEREQCSGLGLIAFARPMNAIRTRRALNGNGFNRARVDGPTFENIRDSGKQ